MTHAGAIVAALIAAAGSTIDTTARAPSDPGIEIEYRSQDDRHQFTDTTCPTCGRQYQPKPRRSTSGKWYWRLSCPACD